MIGPRSSESQFCHPIAGEALNTARTTTEKDYTVPAVRMDHSEEKPEQDPPYTMGGEVWLYVILCSLILGEDTIPPDSVYHADGNLKITSLPPAWPPSPCHLITKVPPPSSPPVQRRDQGEKRFPTPCQVTAQPAESPELRVLSPSQLTLCSLGPVVLLGPRLC